MTRALLNQPPVSDLLQIASRGDPCSAAPLVRDFKDTVYPFFESDTLFLECCFVLFLVV